MKKIPLYMSMTPDVAKRLRGMMKKQGFTEEITVFRQALAVLDCIIENRDEGLPRIFFESEDGERRVEFDWDILQEYTGFSRSPKG